MVPVEPGDVLSSTNKPARVLGIVSSLAVGLVASEAGLSLLPGLALMAMAAVVPRIPLWLGRRRLRPLMDRLRTDPSSPTRLDELDRVRRAWWLAEPTRAEAAGWAALLHIERGDLTPALETIAAHQRTGVPRYRTHRAGMAGEVVGALLGRLFPAVGWTVVPSHTIVVPSELDAERELVPLHTALRLLEAVERGDAAAVQLHWERWPDEFGDAFAALTVMLRHEAASVVPAIASGIHQAVLALSPRPRQLVVLRFPELDPPQGDRYRTPAPMPRTPTPAVALAPTPAGPISPRQRAILRGANHWEYNLGGMVATIVLGIMVPILILPCLVVAVGYFGPRVRVGVSNYRVRRRALASVGIPVGEWRDELLRMRCGTSNSKDVGRQQLYDRELLELIAAVRRAEDALLAANPDQARQAVEWWLDDLHPDRIQWLDPLGLGAALIRLAIVLDYPDALQQLESLQPTDPPVWRRSGHGDAPGAEMLVRALGDVRAGRWSDAGDRLRRAAALPAVSLDPFEHATYSALFDRLEAQGIAIPPKLSRAVSRSPLASNPMRELVGPR